MAAKRWKRQFAIMLIYACDEVMKLVHRNMGFLKGLFKYAPNREAFVELMLLKECTYSRMIDYDTLTFHDVLASRGSGKNDIASITDTV